VVNNPCLLYGLLHFLEFFYKLALISMRVQGFKCKTLGKENITLEILQSSLFLTLRKESHVPYTTVYWRTIVLIAYLLLSGADVLYSMHSVQGCRQHLEASLLKLELHDF
jgi:hypothetical protein